MRARAGIVGFGNFGQFLAARLARQGHEVLATSRTDYGEAASALGVRFFRDADDFVEEARTRLFAGGANTRSRSLSSSSRARSNRTW